MKNWNIFFIYTTILAKNEIKIRTSINLWNFCCLPKYFCEFPMYVFTSVGVIYFAVEPLSANIPDVQALWKKNKKLFQIRPSKRNSIWRGKEYHKAQKIYTVWGGGSPPSKPYMGAEKKVSVFGNGQFSGHFCFYWF